MMGGVRVRPSWADYAKEMNRLGVIGTVKQIFRNSYLKPNGTQVGADIYGNKFLPPPLSPPPSPFLLSPLLFLSSSLLFHLLF